MPREAMDFKTAFKLEPGRHNLSRFFPQLNLIAHVREEKPFNNFELELGGEQTPSSSVRLRERSGDGFSQRIELRRGDEEFHFEVYRERDGHCYLHRVHTPEEEGMPYALGFRGRVLRDLNRRTMELSSFEGGEGDLRREHEQEAEELKRLADRLLGSGVSLVTHGTTVYDFGMLLKIFKEGLLHQGANSYGPLSTRPGDVSGQNVRKGFWFISLQDEAAGRDLRLLDRRRPLNLVDFIVVPEFFKTRLEVLFDDPVFAEQFAGVARNGNITREDAGSSELIQALRGKIFTPRELAAELRSRYPELDES